MIENKKNMEFKEISHKSPSKRSFTNGIHSLLRRADARSLYLICDTYGLSL